MSYQLASFYAVRGGGVIHQIVGMMVQYAIRKWTQSELRFCKIEGSQKSKDIEKGGEMDRKSRKKLCKMIKNLTIHFCK